MDSHLFDDLNLTPKVVDFRFVTVARDRGCLNDEITKELARRVGWHVFDSEIVAYIAQNTHVSEDLVRQLDQMAQNLIEDTIARLLRMPEYASFGSYEYGESLLKTLVCLATHGSAILVGRGANFALRDHPKGLRVLLTASPEVRMRRLSESSKVSVEEVRRRMQADDEERRKFIRKYYRQDFDDARAYDIVFNTDRASANQVASSILAFMNHP
jgi:cytidylate kinase